MLMNVAADHEGAAAAATTNWVVFMTRWSDVRPMSSNVCNARAMSTLRKY